MLKGIATASIIILAALIAPSEVSADVSCGGHRADTCEICPICGTNNCGRGWCNGECAWNDDVNKCLPPATPAPTSASQPTTVPSQSMSPTLEPPNTGLPDIAFWTNYNWGNDLVKDNGNLPTSTNLFEGNVIFAQSQTIPYNIQHWVGQKEQQPRLTSKRDTLLLFRPHALQLDTTSEDQVKLTVYEPDGTIAKENIIMNHPKDIPRHMGYIDLSPKYNTYEDLDLPPNNDATYNSYDWKIVNSQYGIDNLGDDPTALKFREQLPITKHLSLITANGRWKKDFYLPDLSSCQSGVEDGGPDCPIPIDSVVNFENNAAWDINVHYHNAHEDYAEHRSHAVKQSKRLMVHIVDDGEKLFWISEFDFEHNQYIFGFGFFSADLEANWVKPGMTLEFSLVKEGSPSTIEKNGYLTNINIGGETELIINMIDLGFLIEPRDEYQMFNNFEYQYEYFRTLPVSRVIIVQYESQHLDEVVFNDGSNYTDVSTNERCSSCENGQANVYWGDLRDLANNMFTSGINKANGYSGPQPMITAMMSRGVYEKCTEGGHSSPHSSGCVQIHGMLGGAKMASIIDSVHNEWSHEIGHNWIGGHYVGCYDGTVHSPSSHSNSAWGWDSKKRKFIQNFSRTNSGKNTCMSKEYKSPENTYCTDKCREPFLGKYQYDTGSMGGGKGSNSGDGKNYAFYSPAEAKMIQDKMEKWYLYDKTSSTGFRMYNSETGNMDEYSSTTKPEEYGVPVTVVLGYYDPFNTMRSHIYPAIHSAYGFVYADDGKSSNECKLIVKTNNGEDKIFYLRATNDKSGIMRSFQQTIATDDDPYEATIICDDVILATRTLEKPKKKLYYSVNGEVIDESASNPSLTTSPESSPTSSPTPSPTFPSTAPSKAPSKVAILPSDIPSTALSDVPSLSPLAVPSTVPSKAPSKVAVLSSDIPSTALSDVPSFSHSAFTSTVPSKPSSSDVPSFSPSTIRSTAPSKAPAPVICSVLNGWKCKKKNQQCIWETVTKSCYGKDELPACSAATLKRKCTKLKEINSKCVWSGQSKTCGELDCSDYNGSWNFCNKNKIDCKWEYITKTCLGKDELPPCSNLNVKKKCKSKNYSGHCTWSTSEKACNDK